LYRASEGVGSRNWRSGGSILLARLAA
jgi:hypothetical protein